MPEADFAQGYGLYRRLAGTESHRRCSRRDNNELALCIYIVPALRDLGDAGVRKARRSLRIFNRSIFSRVPSEAALIILQQEVLEFVLDRLDDSKRADQGVRARIGGGL